MTGYAKRISPHAIQPRLRQAEREAEPGKKKNAQQSAARHA